MFKRIPTICLITIAVLAIMSACTPTSGSSSQSANNAAKSSEQRKRKNVILMISDGIGFNGWLASDYYQYGQAGAQVYQRTLPSSQPVHTWGMSHWALTFVNERGTPVKHDGSSMPAGAVGAIPQLYDPATRWEDFEGAFRWDFNPVNIPYTSYTDSAASITAFVTGHKTTNGRLNMSWDASERYTTIAQSADAMGLATGAVSSVQVSHATPAGVWSHSATRHAYPEIFAEMSSSGLDVIIGAGHPMFDDDGNKRAEADYKYIGEKEWSAATSKQGLNGFTLVENKAGLLSIAQGKNVPTKLLGVAPVASTLQAVRSTSETKADTPSGDPFIESSPSLATMSGAALNVLNQDPDGFFLMIEGGAVDWMNHANNLPRMIEEQMDFDRAVATVIEWVEKNSSWDETLLIVTSDHDCGSLWGAGCYDVSESGRTKFNPDRGDKLINFKAIENAGRGVIPAHQYASGYHTNDLVPLWAIGQNAEALHRYAKMDVKAGDLWGKPYGWNGRYLDTTELYRVMMGALDLKVKP